MAEKSGISNWIGPVLGAIILIGGYVAYQQWHEQDQHNKQCAALQHSFMSNTNTMIDNLNPAMDKAIKEHSRAALVTPSLVATTATGEVLSSALDAQCPDWQHKIY